MRTRFLDYIRKEHLIAEGQRVLLAVSGGRDSVAMAHLFHAAGMDFAVAHCNFHLRPGDCDRDEQFVRRLADGYGVPCFVAQFQTAEYASTHRLSVEEAAREQRYSFFEEVRDREDFDLIATAHHRDDSIETFFINLLRGTGIHGLCGIPPRRGNIVRPLLCFGREDINRYVADNNLQYVEDYTNSQTVYLRNRIRLTLLPLLRQLSPSFDTTMQGNIDRLGESAALFDETIDSKRRKLVQNWTIPISSLREETSPKTVLYELLKPYGFTGDMVASIMSSLDAQSGLRFFSPTHCLVKDRTSLVITPISDTAAMETYSVTAEMVLQGGQLAVGNSLLTMAVKPLDGLFGMQEYGNTGVPPVSIPMGRCTMLPRFKTQKNEALFDFGRLKFPLMLRHWRRGDRFRPFGMKGSRLVSDLFSDQKLSLPEKERVWLLCDAEGTILWVVGLRTSSHCSITSETRQILRLSVQ